ncbi:RagB/SusD family nutrient uptake outer membrane protein [Niabella drilacis]|uniref:Starch-binding associating with outer membrane n=1 Tax=Niabella drilacis (strain DSM 25811 / CCM 8410 / CCUG 62505 / LMG 26954 / E90) TaxID=1285928 RepID=A0A1G6TDF4_NIADE|nr:RagB/SusD family nutrient uptake outer membrane protein [Niabella drilacis]SDD26467.1 Starch-binding associating with outer membrane [Niabella drilacis]
MTRLALNSFFLQIFCLLLILTIGAGCEKGLTPRSYTDLTPANFPKNEADLNTAVTGVYNKFRQQDRSRDFTAAYIIQKTSVLVNNLSTTDEFATDWAITPQMIFTLKPTDLFAEQFWSRAQPTITLATITIEMVKAADYISDKRKAALVSELRCIRAIYAYDLYDEYGPVPIMTDPEIVSDLQKAQNYKPARPSQQEYSGFLVKELTEAALNLPTVTDNADFGRMSKGIALTCLLKLYMHDKQWAKAEAVSKEIIDLNYYMLQPNFKDIWAVNNENNKEIIWAIPYTGASGFENTFHFAVLPGDFKSLSEGQTPVPIQSWGQGYKLPWPVWDSFDPSDKRREVFQRYYWNGKAMVDLKASSSGAIPLKYPIDPNMTGAGSATDFVIYRYADVLLYRAEALNELNGANAESLDIINRLRTRAGLDTLAAGNFNQSTLRAQILKERQWELCFEGVRRQDLIRNGSFVSNALARGRQFVQPFHVLFPIPQYAINENPNIHQNTGY